MAKQSGKKSKKATVKVKDLKMKKSGTKDPKGGGPVKRYYLENAWPQKCSS